MALEKMKADVHDLVDWKDSVDKDVDELKAWKSTVSGKLDDLIKENQEMRWSVEEMRGLQEMLQNKELAVLSISLFFACLALFKLACDRVLCLFAGKGNREERRRGWSPCSRGCSRGCTRAGPTPWASPPAMVPRASRSQPRHIGDTLPTLRHGPTALGR